MNKILAAFFGFLCVDGYPGLATTNPFGNFCLRQPLIPQFLGRGDFVFSIGVFWRDAHFYIRRGFLKLLCSLLRGNRYLNPGFNDFILVLNVKQMLFAKIDELPSEAIRCAWRGIFLPKLALLFWVLDCLPRWPPYIFYKNNIKNIFVNTFLRASRPNFAPHDGLQWITSRTAGKPHFWSSPGSPIPLPGRNICWTNSSQKKPPPCGRWMCWITRNPKAARLLRLPSQPPRYSKPPARH